MPGVRYGELTFIIRYNSLAISYAYTFGGARTNSPRRDLDS